jgi:predicted RNA-binding Zn ribbon-like protein
MRTDDPRPLRGEPLSLDLVNTRWIGPAGRQDLLADTDGLAIWLDQAGLSGEGTADEATLDAVRFARDALVSALIEQQDTTAVNDVLARGRIQRRIVDGAPVDDVEVDDPAWRIAWLAADDYTRLLRTAPHRIRPCANDQCILHFYDTSKNGTRRWCSMAGCGNRAKVARHYDRTRQG